MTKIETLRSCQFRFCKRGITRRSTGSLTLPVNSALALLSKMTNETSNKEEIRNILLAEFEEVRETPGAHFNPEKFIHFLIANPDGKRTVHNSFKGKRYFVRFIRCIETKFGVCFSNSDLETIVGLSKMTERVAYLQSTPKSSLTVIANRLRDPFNPNIVIVIVFLSLPIVYALYKLLSYVGLISLGIPAFATALVVHLHRRDRIHYETLHQQIMKANKVSEAKPDSAPQN